MICFGLDLFTTTFITDYSSPFGIIWDGMVMDIITVIIMEDGLGVGMEMDIIITFTEILTLLMFQEEEACLI
jgi:hypothetical protein